MVKTSETILLFLFFSLTETVFWDSIIDNNRKVPYTKFINYKLFFPKSSQKNVSAVPCNSLASRGSPTDYEFFFLLYHSSENCLKA